MRTNEELRGMPNLMILQTAADGGNGRMIFGKLDASVIWSTGAGWDHVSISPFKSVCQSAWKLFASVETAALRNSASTADTGGNAK